MIADPQALLLELQSRGLAATGDAHVAPVADEDRSPERPWYVATLLGASGWLAGLFLLAFIGALFRTQSAGVAAVCGAILLASAWTLFKTDGEGMFVGQFALALSIAGQCLVLFAMTEHTRGIATVAAAALMLQLALAALMPNRLHRSLSTVFATIAWALTVRFALFGEPDFWRATGEAAAPSLGSAFAGWLLAWLPVTALLWSLIRREAAWMARGWQPVLRPVIHGLVIGLAFATMASQPFEPLRWFGGNPHAGIDWLALWPLLSALGALVGVAAAFALRSRALIATCAVAVLLYMSQLYYELGVSLLFKSLTMVVLGAAMLMAARWLTRGERA